jgi:hypothetical protein
MALPFAANDDGLLSDFKFGTDSIDFASQFPEADPVAGAPASPIEQPRVVLKKIRKVNMFIYLLGFCFRN